MCTPQGIIDKLGGLVFDEAVKAATQAGKYVLYYKTNLKNLQDEMVNLQYQMDVIGTGVRDATERGDREVFPAVLLWQTEADKMMGDVQNFLGQSSGADVEQSSGADVDKMTSGVQELDGQSSGADVDKMTRGDQENVGQSSMVNMTCFGCTCPNIKQRHRLGKQAEKTIPDVQKLIAQALTFTEISRPRPPPQEDEFTSMENYITMNSRTPIFDGIVDALKQSGINIIGVHGLGGVGKTTLVKEIAKKVRVDKTFTHVPQKMPADGTFTHVPLVTVTKEFNVMEIQNKLAGDLNVKLDAPTDEKSNRNQLWQKFKNGEKYLVILDDIWDKVDLNAIGIPIAHGCKVILTSRKEDLLGRTMRADKNFAIEKLSDLEAWTLFKKEVGDSIESRQEIAYEVCKRCDGLPVAINALGAALRDQPAHAWEDALKKLERCMITQIEGIDPSVWVSLKFSYDMLQSSNAKSCFLLCCLFPEDAEIRIDDLTRHCVARRDLLSPNPGTLEEARNSVLTVVDTLKSANLLSNGTNAYGIKENFVRIHDIIRDVGILIGRDLEKPVLVDLGALPENVDNGQSYSAISINFKGIKGLPDDLVYPQLHTLMLYNTELSDVEVPDNFFHGMAQLKVLIITRMRMHRLPSSLAKLTNLRMLYLNGCELEDIAMLKDLKTNLEVLSLQDTSIEALPQDIGLLTRLRVLDLQDCKTLKVIPQGVISNLTSLEELYFPVASCGDFKFSFLEELKRSLSTGHLSILHICIGDFVEGLKFENLKRFCISTGEMPGKFPYSVGSRVLHLGDVKRGCSYLGNDLIPLVDKAEILRLENFEGLKKLLHDRGVGNEFPHLRYLEVESCDEMLHPSFLFKNLTWLVVRNCKLKYLLSPTTAKALAHLERLRLEDCEHMEEIVGFEEQSEELTCEVKFSKLKRLELRKLPNLICFYAEKEKKRTTMESSPGRPHSLFNHQVSLPALNDLRIEDVPEIKKIWDMQPELESAKDTQSWCKLQILFVTSCPKLVFAFPSWMLPRLQNLEDLHIKTCKEIQVIISSNKEEKNNNIIVFPKLERLDVESSPNLKSFFGETQLCFFEKVSLPALNDLRIQDVPEIKKIWDMQPELESAKDTQSWCKLQILFVTSCPKLVFVFPSWMLPRLQNLEDLHIKTCKEIHVIISSNKEEKNNNIIVFPKLERLDVESSPNLKSFFGETQLCFFEKVSLPALNDLRIQDVPEIKKIWDMQPELESAKDTQSWCKLQILFVTSCPKLVFVFPSWMLPRLQNLEDLHIKTCKEIQVIISSSKEEKNNNIIVFPKLERLDVESSPNLKSFFGETQLCFFEKVSLPALNDLRIQDVPEIKKIWDMQPELESAKDTQSWCKLQILFVTSCPKLVFVFPSWMLPRLQNLEDLHIKTCKEIQVIISSSKEEKNNNIIVFPKLERLDVESSPNLKSFFGETQLCFFEKVSLPALNDLRIQDVPEIKKIWDMQPELESAKDTQSWCKLQILFVTSCPKLVFVFPSWMLPRLQNLEDLHIKTCKEIQVIISSNKEGKNNNIIVFPKLERLDVESSPNLKSFFGETQLCFFEKVSLPALNDLRIQDVPEIKKIWDMQPELESAKDTQSWCKLEILFVTSCPKLVFVFPSWMLPRLQNLEDLHIKTCKEIQVIISSNKEEKNNNIIVFPKLERLDVESSPNLKSFFGETQLCFFEKVSLPALNDLRIQDVPEIKKIWDMQPELESAKDTQSWCKLQILFVTSCPKLVFVFPSWMLPRLQNLEDLHIKTCKEIQVIISSNKEEKNNNIIVFPKLERLDVESSPNLKSFFGETQLCFFEKVSLPALDDLRIEDVTKIKKIWDMQPELDSAKDAQPWCKLQILFVKSCDKLVFAFPYWMLPQLQNLQDLRIENCKEMEMIISSNKEAKNKDIIVFPRLEILYVESSPNLKSFFGETQLYFFEKVSLPALDDLRIEDVPKIKKIWDMQPELDSAKDAQP